MNQVDELKSLLALAVNELESANERAPSKGANGRRLRRLVGDMKTALEA